MIQLLEVLGTVMLLGAMMWGMMRFMLKEIHSDLIGIKTDMLEMKADMLEMKTEMKTEIKKQSQRTDHLYEILIDLVKKKS
jgi:hypothetical protein